MAAMWETVTEVYEEYMASGDPRVTPWLFMESPVPTIILVSLYVAIVKVIGPAWMMDRKPFDLRSAMFAYNMGLVVTHTYVIAEVFKVLFKSQKSLICRIVDPNDPEALRLAELGWLYYIIKLVEFADTVFFVLRKKFQQISTLHVVHHAVVPLAVWTVCRVEPDGNNYFFPLINCIVHVVMYTYYGLSALGPSVQKHLWWKKYLTTIQILQFVSVFLYFGALSLGNCRSSKFSNYMNIFVAGLFFVMFCNFYLNTYVKNKNSRSGHS